MDHTLLYLLDDFCEVEGFTLWTLWPHFTRRPRRALCANKPRYTRFTLWTLWPHFTRRPRRALCANKPRYTRFTLWTL